MNILKRKQIETWADLPWPGDIEPRLPKAEAELVALQDAFCSLNKKLSDVRREMDEIKDYRVSPEFQQRDNQHKKNLQKTIEKLSADRARMKADAVVLTTEIEGLRNNAKSAIKAVALPQQLELLKMMFLEELRPVASMHIAREKIAQLNREFSVRSMNPLPNATIWARLENQSQQLREDAHELIEMGAITAADLPPDLAKAWRIK